MQALASFSSYIPGRWGGSAAPRPVRIPTPDPVRGFDLRGFFASKIADLASTEPAFADRSGPVVNRVTTASTSSLRIVGLGASGPVRHATLRPIFPNNATANREHTGVISLGLQAEPRQRYFSQGSFRAGRPNLQTVTALTSARSQAGKVASLDARARLTVRASEALGENGSSRVSMFQIMKAGWDHGEGRQLNPASLSGLNRFLEIADSGTVTYSVFMTHAGNLSLGWRDSEGAYVEVEFTTATECQYYIERSDQEGSVDLTTEGIATILGAEVLAA